MLKDPSHIYTPLLGRPPRQLPCHNNVSLCAKNVFSTSKRCSPFEPKLIEVIDFTTTLSLYRKSETVLHLIT